MLAPLLQMSQVGCSSPQPRLLAWCSVSTRYLEGSSTYAHISRGSRCRAWASERHISCHHFHKRQSRKESHCSPVNYLTKPRYMCRVMNTRKFMGWICAKSSRKLVAQMEGEFPIPVPETSDCFQATICALRSLGESEGVTFYSLTPRGSMCAPVEKLGQSHARS
jgi:hypothetical protein